MNLGIASGIVVLVYLTIEILKKSLPLSDKQKDMIPLLGIILGIVYALGVFCSGPALGIEIYVGDNMITAILTGLASGLVATGSNQFVKKANKLAKGEYDGFDDDLDRILDENKDLEIKK